MQIGNLSVFGVNFAQVSFIFDLNFGQVRLLLQLHSFCVRRFLRSHRFRMGSLLSSHSFFGRMFLSSHTHLMSLLFCGECLTVLAEQSLNFGGMSLRLAIHFTEVTLLFAGIFHLHFLNGLLELLDFSHQRVLVLFLGPCVFLQLDSCGCDSHLQMFP